MTDVNKAIKPVESTIIAPINDGAEYKTNNYIQFMIGASQMNMWLVNNSYLSFDLNYTGVNPVGGNHAAWANMCPSYIKNANNIFSSIEVLYGGDTIYSQPYNIEQNTLKQLYYGEDYLKTNFMTFTTREMVLEDKAAGHLNVGQTAYLKLKNDAAANGALANQIIKNIMIPINQLIPFFMDMGSEGFPVRCLKNQIEIRLYIAEPYRYLVDWDPVVGDFYNDNKFLADNAANYTGAVAYSASLRFTNSSIKLENVRMFCQHYLPDAGLAGRIDNEALNSAEGMKWQFVRTEIAKRQVTKIGPTNNIPMTAATENTQSLMLYCHKNELSPGVMFRPNINALYIKFGSNQLPFQPVPHNSFDYPFEYKFLTDDVLNNIDTYHSETNHDYTASYRFINSRNADDTADITRADVKVPTSSFVLMAANYVSDPNSLGASSSLWNSSYQVSFNGRFTEDIPLTFILGIESKWGLLLQNGKLTTINI